MILTRMYRTTIGPAELKQMYDKTKPIVKDGIPLLVRHLKARLSRDEQNVVVIDGGTGSGKSSLAVYIATLLNPKWKMAENYIYDEKDLKRRLATLNEPYPVLLMDEGSIILNSKNSLCKSDKKIVSLFDAMRVKHVTTLICCPNAMKLNKTVISDHVDFRLICPKKAPLEGYKARGFTHVHSHWHMTWKNKDSWPFMFTTVFPKMTKAQQLEYDSLKARSLNKLISEFAEAK